MSDFPSQKQDKFVLRLPDGLRDRIKNKADSNGRSMNAEIVQLLEREYPAPRDVMYIHADDIRKALDLYERETDPKERMRLQIMVAALVTSGHSMTVEFDDEG